MSYYLEGLDWRRFAPLFDADAQTLRAARAERVHSTSDTAFPCRTSLSDAAAGTPLLLLHHVSNDVDGPFRMAHAIYITAAPVHPAAWHDRLPPMLARRRLGLRALDADGALIGAALAVPGEAEDAVVALFEDDRVVRIDAHNAAQGCFLAHIRRA